MNRAKRILAEILANPLLTADEKAIEIVTRLSINPLYNKGAARYEFVKDIRVHQRKAADHKGTSTKVSLIDDAAFIAMINS